MLRNASLIVAMFISLPVAVYAQDHTGHDHAAHDNHAVQKNAQHDSTHMQKGLSLPDDVRLLLNQEMQEIRKGMASLVLAVATADWHSIVQTGKAIQNSYILNRELSKQQTHQLQTLLPPDFKERDQQLHHYAGSLALAAEKQDMELTQFYIYQMNQACTGCHAKYVEHRFPGFTKSAQQLEHHH